MSTFKIYFQNKPGTETLEADVFIIDGGFIRFDDTNYKPIGLFKSSDVRKILKVEPEENRLDKLDNLYKKENIFKRIYKKYFNKI